MSSGARTLCSVCRHPIVVDGREYSSFEHDVRHDVCPCYHEGFVQARDELRGAAPHRIYLSQESVKFYMLAARIEQLTMNDLRVHHQLHDLPLMLCLLLG